jgi:hypothetical protein
MILSIGRVYVQYFNSTYRRTGTLWKERYKAAIIDDERYLLTCMRCIEQSGASSYGVSPGEFPWSSFSRTPAADDLVEPRDLSTARSVAEAAGRLSPVVPLVNTGGRDIASAMRRSMWRWAARHFVARSPHWAAAQAAADGAAMHVRLRPA